MSPSATLGVLLRSDGHEAAHYALILATAAAAVGRGVVLFATNGGCRLLLKATPLADDPREALLGERGVAGIRTLLEAARDLGVRLVACEAGLRAEAIEPDALAEGVEIAGVATFLAALGPGQIASL